MSMERLRAALLGCLLTGGVLFGARPVQPEHRPIRPVVYAAGPGNALGRSLAELAHWFQPLTCDPLPVPSPPPARNRGRCCGDHRRCR